MSRPADDISIEELLGALKADVPDLEIRSADRLREGLDHIVLEINSTYIVRFARPDWNPPIDEVAVLSLFRGKTTAAIPDVIFRGRSFNYMGYRKIPGVTLSEEEAARIPAVERRNLSRQIAKFMFELHTAITPAAAADAGLHRYDVAEFDNIYPTLAAKYLNDRKLVEFARNVIDEFSQTSVDCALQRVLHWDMHNGNMILNPADYALAGIVDFDTVRIADVHAEFRSLYRFNPALAQETLEVYQELTGLNLSFRHVMLYAWLVKLSDLAVSIDKPESTMYRNAEHRLQHWIQKECGEQGT